MLANTIQEIVAQRAVNKTLVKNVNNKVNRLSEQVLKKNLKGETMTITLLYVAYSICC